MKIKHWTCFLVGLMSLWGGFSWGSVNAYWTGKGGDNKWGTAANWSGNVVPGLTDQDWRVQFEGKTCTVEIEAGVTYTVDDWFRVADGSHVTLTGSGTVKNTNWTYVNEGSSLTIDGPVVTVNKADNNDVPTIVGEIRVKSGSFQKSGPIIAGETRVFVEGGNFGSTTTLSGNKLTVTNNAEVIVTGGEFDCGYLNLRSNGDGTGGTMRLLGGLCSFWNANQYLNVIGSGATFDFKGGTVLWPSGSSIGRAMNFSGTSSSMREQHKCFLPPKNTTLVIPTSYADDAALGFNMNGEFAVGGTVYVTNATNVAAGNVKLGATDISVAGGGTIYANGLSCAASDGSAVANVDLAAVHLGAGGITGGSFSQTVTIPNGITFGAWADWSMSSVSKTTIAVKGPLAFDTADALDAEKGSHAIVASRFDVADTTEIVVKGGGSVALTPTSCPNQLRRISVADGGTLALAGPFGVVKTMDFRLGAGSQLQLDISEGGSVDIAATAAFGAGSKIVVTQIPATLTDKKQYPIINLPPRKGDPAAYPTVELSASVTEGWGVRWVANSCYLGLATTVASTYTTEKSWTGKGANNLYSNTNNWLNGKVGTGTTIVYFAGTSNTVVNVDASDHTCRYMRIVDSNTGAYVFRGNELKFRYPYEGLTDADTFASVRLDADRPVVIENDINNYYQTVSSVKKYATHFRFWSLGQGSVSVMGDSKKTLPLGYRGDVRIGGTWTTTDLQPRTTERRTGLTVLPNGVLTVTAQETVQNVVEYFAIAAGGAMTVGGTKFAFTREGTHFVDGAFTVNCPYETLSNQTFRGSGTLTLAGGVSAPAGATAAGIRLEGEDLTLVPGGAWSADVPLSVRGSVTLAPTADWTLAAPLALDDHATLTVSAEGKSVRLDAPVVSKGEVAVSGGRLVLGAAGTQLWKVTCAKGASLDVADGVLSGGSFTDVLSVRRDDPSLVFPERFRIRKRYDLASDSTVYSARAKQGLMLILR